MVAVYDGYRIRAMRDPPHGPENPMPISLNKRLKEKARQEKQQDKAESGSNAKSSGISVRR